MLPTNYTFSERFRVSKKIGHGAFGETYAATDLVTHAECAVKVERTDTRRTVLRLEIAALRRLQSCPRIVTYLSSGRQEDYSYVVMTRLGENLAELRKATSANRFTYRTVCYLAPQMIEAIAQVHSHGYLHRDIKPSNFCVGGYGYGQSSSSFSSPTSPSSSSASLHHSTSSGNHFQVNSSCRDVFLIDFGLARKFRTPNGDIRAPRPMAGFRGTARYASLQSHRGEELGRRDDLWSLLYVLIEMAVGHLPWRRVKDKEGIGRVKEHASNEVLTAPLPPAFHAFRTHLASLRFEDEPNYDFLSSIFRNELGGSTNFLLDWEAPAQGLQDPSLYVPVHAEHLYSEFDGEALQALLRQSPPIAPHPPMEPRGAGQEKPLRKAMLMRRRPSLPVGVGTTNATPNRRSGGSGSGVGLGEDDDDLRVEDGEEDERVYATQLQRTYSGQSSPGSIRQATSSREEDFYDVHDTQHSSKHQSLSHAGNGNQQHHASGQSSQTNANHNHDNQDAADKQGAEKKKGCCTVQ
jgi:tau tubulin kinase